MSMRALSAPVLLFPCLWACGGKTPPPVPETPPIPTSTAAKVEPPKKPAFENPGGMWMPHQLAEHKDTLAALGLEVDPAMLTDPMSPVLGAVVSLGGCSASFVSPEGLLATNHHCATAALQYSSTPQANLLVDGYLAKTRADEKWNGPAARVWVTQKVTEVTRDVLDGVEKIADHRARYKAIEAKQKALVADCEKGRPTMRCSVARFFDGERFYRIEQLELRDIRLVWAPPAGVGNYGGEIDNWRWPRHTGDVTFFRAYVGKDGQPADHSAENVPYSPKHFLKVASKPLAEGDLVFVAGYPGRTNTLKTKAEVDEAVEWSYPRRQKESEDYLAVLEKLAAEDPAIAIKATQLIRGHANRLTNTKGQLEGLVKGGLAAAKAKVEADLAGWIEADAARKATWGGILEEMATAHAARVKTRDDDADLRELASAARLMGAAVTIARMAEERAKPDAERHPDYQERNWKRIKEAQLQLSKSYDPKLDQALFLLAAKRIAARAGGAAILAPVLGKKAPTEENLRAAIAALYAKTKLGDEKVRVELVEKGTVASLKKSADSLVKLALVLRPKLQDVEDRDDAYAGQLAVLRPKYIQALRAHAGRELAPDANSTLRVTYGTVRSYRPAPDAPQHAAFTKLSEVLAKNTGKKPFDAPPRLVQAAEAKKLGPYVDAKLQEVPVNFLADLHITGGNSGSATLNARGEITGLVFDANYEAMASDWVFMPGITRSIHVDLRYVLWLLDAVDGADHLLTELGVTPAVQ